MASRRHGESDFNFVSRLLEEEGIFYFFEHQNGKHVLVLGDSPQAHKPCEGQSTAQYGLAPGGWQQRDMVTHWSCQKAVCTGQYALSDYNFLTPETSLLTDKSGPSPFQKYEYPGVYEQPSQGEARTRVRWEQEQVGQQVAGGSGQCRSFSAGRTFTLAGHYLASQNQAWTLIAMKHEIKQGPTTGQVQARIPTITMAFCVFLRR
jgi:type VI secretion system secreted protein VgrG